MLQAALKVKSDSCRECGVVDAKDKKGTRQSEPARKPRWNIRMHEQHPAGGGWGYRLRVWQSAARRLSPVRTMSARLRVKCGCCDESVDIVYDEHSIEINGVIAPIEEWRAIFGPLLEGREPIPSDPR
jgi:hypothetical protein